MTEDMATAINRMAHAAWRDGTLNESLLQLGAEVFLYDGYYCVLPQLLDGGTQWAAFQLFESYNPSGPKVQITWTTGNGQRVEHTGNLLAAVTAAVVDHGARALARSAVDSEGEA